MNDLMHFDGPTFEADVLRSDRPVVVDFYADWCPPCRAMTPAVERLATELSGTVSIGKLDVDSNQELAIRYGVMSIPTLGLFKDGKLIDRMVGFPGGTAPIRAWIAKSVELEPAAKS